MIDTKELLKKYEPTKDAKIIAADPQVRGARFSPCGKLLVGGGYDARVRRWNRRRSARTACPGRASRLGRRLAFRAEGELLFTADSWGQLRCWSGYRPTSRR